ncbi:MAG: FAD:protein FMN transferase [Clostridia bacterium]|nr:FAD:protein FMN transferase [Clostridia bacterium]
MKQRSHSAVLALLLSVIMAACTVCAESEVSPPAENSPGAAVYARFNRVETGVFDTVISLTAFAASQEDFDRAADEAMSLLRSYHQLLDGYHEYDGLHNLWYVNHHAAQEPVEVPEEFFRLLSWCREQWDQGQRKTNIAMGAVLSVWHDYRMAGIDDPQHAELPPMETLQAAAQHTDFDSLILDADNRTVFFADPLLQLDLGAVAKGYAADAANAYLSQVMPSYLLSLGGNVYAGEAPMDGRANWSVGVQDPRINAGNLVNGTSDILDILDVHCKTVVTSGDYWRYYVVDNQRYHHIIDPDTLYPSVRMQSVSVVCDSSLLADFLSTTLFILSYEDGLQLVESMEGVEAMWVLPDGTIQCSAGMAAYARSLKSADGGK